MHQTTVRFGPDLWEALEAECSDLGVSVAQYLREAALARLAYTAGRRGEPDYDVALVAATVPGQTVGGLASAQRLQGLDAVTNRAESDRVAATSVERGLEASALGAESELVRKRARAIRDQAKELRDEARRQRWQRR